jgi:hypothetical protein
MLWLSRILIVLLVFSLVSGRAYFIRGLVSKKTNPKLYWKLVAFYLLMTSMIFIKLAIPSLENLFSDAATRAAKDIEAGIQHLKQSQLASTTLPLPMKTSPKGCEEDYTLQISQASALVIWCKTAGKVTSSHTTTSHLPFVLVPQTFSVEKKKGEIAFLDLQLQNGAAVVTGLH